MTDTPKPPADETPIQRALRLKQAALAARGQAPGGDKLKPDKRAPAGASKPWMKR